MEKFTDINQLKPGTQFIVIDGDEVTFYEFLCVHPKHPKYILALESCSQDGKKLYVPELLNQPPFERPFRCAYVGEWDDEFVINKQIEFHNRSIAKLEERLNKILEKRNNK